MLDVTSCRDVVFNLDAIENINSQLISVQNATNQNRGDRDVQGGQLRVRANLLRTFDVLNKHTEAEAQSCALTMSDANTTTPRVFIARHGKTKSNSRCLASDDPLTCPFA